MSVSLKQSAPCKPKTLKDTKNVKSEHEIKDEVGEVTEDYITSMNLHSSMNMKVVQHTIVPPAEHMPASKIKWS